MLDSNELRTLLKTIYSLFFENVPDAELDRIIENAFSNVDLNEDGKMSLSEFQSFAMTQPRIIRCFMPPMSPSERMASVEAFERRNGANGESASTSSTPSDPLITRTMLNSV